MNHSLPDTRKIYAGHTGIVFKTPSLFEKALLKDALELRNHDELINYYIE